MRTDIVCIGLHYPTSRHTSPADRSGACATTADEIQRPKTDVAVARGSRYWRGRHRPRCLAGALVVVVVLPVCGLRHPPPCGGPPGGDPPGGGAEGGGPLPGGAASTKELDLGVPDSFRALRFSFLAARSDSSASTFARVSVKSRSTSPLFAWTIASNTWRPNSFFAVVTLPSSMVISAVILARCAARFEASPAAIAPDFILSRKLILRERKRRAREGREKEKSGRCGVCANTGEGHE